MAVSTPEALALPLRAWATHLPLLKQTKDRDKYPISNQATVTHNMATSLNHRLRSSFRPNPLNRHSFRLQANRIPNSTKDSSSNSSNSMECLLNSHRHKCTPLGDSLWPFRQGSSQDSTHTTVQSRSRWRFPK